MHSIRTEHRMDDSIFLHGSLDDSEECNSILFQNILYSLTRCMQEKTAVIQNKKSFRNAVM